MFLIPLILILQASATPQTLTFPVSSLTVISFTQKSSNRTLSVPKERAVEIRKILGSGRRDPAVFMAEYVIHIKYKNRSTAILVNRDRFKYDGKTYKADEDIGHLLASLFAHH